MRFLTLVAALVVTLAASTTAYAPYDVMAGDLVNGTCTLGFPLEGTASGAHAGQRFFLTADHCIPGHVGVGQTMNIHGYYGEYQGALGTVVARGGYQTSGIVANDWALIEVNAAYHDKVVPAVRGLIHGAVTGYTTASSVDVGDVTLHSGWGQGPDASEFTAENRVGVVTYHDDDVYVGYMPTVPGDSGGPVVHQETGAALGLVTGLYAGFGVSAEYGAFAGPYVTGPTVEGVLRQVMALGYDVDVMVA